mgnify:CR=1 FL=1
MIFQEINKIPKKQRVLITSHDAFQYFGRHYGIRLESILGTSTDAEAQTADVMRVQKVIAEVHQTTLPALQFLESEGFYKDGHVDIFEAGPRITCAVESIKTVKNSQVKKAKIVS